MLPRWTRQQIHSQLLCRRLFLACSDTDHGNFEEKKVDAFEETPLHMRESTEGGGTLRQTRNQNGRPNAHVHSPPLKKGLPRSVSLIGRALLCDIPMFCVFLAYFSLLLLSHVETNYLSEQLRAFHFSDQRRAEEITYYTRPCSGEDISARKGADLFLPAGATIDEAYHHQLRHGFTVFPNVLSPETATALRQHVAERNSFNSSDSESIFVIENDKRYSFGLETTYPVVANAMTEIANHRLLRPALEKILGRNPALIEMTAITSSYGAVDQYWHDDVIPTASAIRYARTFGPSYSVFVQLQNTTKAMGATDACPGTHYCSAPGVENVCEQYGFQMVGDDGYWHAGDALLMNMNSYHRGKAHTDPYGQDRVMLILTFTTRPRSRAESRQLSQGITFSLRWDEWGHTLEDMAQAGRIMQKPWTLLRALGLFKLPGTEWGIDYITSGSMRMANEDNGFREDEFEEFMERGGIWWIPGFLQGQVSDDDSWLEYYLDTGKRCLEFVQYRLLPISLGSYLLLGATLGLLSTSVRAPVAFGKSLRRLLVLGSLAYCFYHLAIYRIDSTDWAKDIRHKKRHWGVFKNQRAFGITNQGPSTLPHRRDVLIENRYGSAFLAMYEDFIDGHPGNRLFQHYVAASADQFGRNPKALKSASAVAVFQSISDHQGRFLYQGPTGAWEWLNDVKALEYVHRYLASQSHPMKKMLTRAIRHLISGYMYDVHRETKMAQRHAVPYLRQLETRLIGATDALASSSMTQPVNSSLALRQSLTRPLVPFIKKNLVNGNRNQLPPEVKVEEPEIGAWLTDGDAVECLEDDEYWYPATILHITAHGEYVIRWATGETGKSEIGYVRPFDGYLLGQELEVFDEDNDDHMDCSVIRVNDDGTYAVRIIDDGTVYSSVRPGILRRPADEIDLNVATYKAAY